MGEPTSYKKPRPFNWVTLAVLGALGGGVWAGWLYIPVYHQRYKVDEILNDIGIKSQDLVDMAEEGVEKEEQRLIEEARARIQALGIATEDNEADLDVSYDEDYTTITAEYQVTRTPLVGKPRTFKFTRTGRIPQAKGSSFD